METGQLAIIWLLLSTLAICGVVFGWRYLINKENMSMIEKGQNPKLRLERPRPAPFRSLKWGLLLGGAGLGLFVAYLMDHTLLYNFGHDVSKFSNDGEINGGNVPLYFAFITIFAGAGLITSYRIEKRELLDKENRE